MSAGGCVACEIIESVRGIGCPRATSIRLPSVLDVGSSCGAGGAQVLVCYLPGRETLECGAGIRRGARDLKRPLGDGGRVRLLVWTHQLDGDRDRSALCYVRVQRVR